MENEQKAIHAEAKALVTKIREYCRIQATVWQTIPRLALEADGRQGWCDQLGRAYYYKTWALTVCGTGANGYVACIDLQNGKIVSTLDTSKPADDRDVLSLAWDLNELDASRLASRLKAEAKEPKSRLVITRSKNEHEEILRSLHLQRLRGPVPLRFE